MFTLHNGDCLQVMPSIPSGSIDAIITDLPYGTTACEWDSVIPLVPMWKEVKRVLKPNGAFITTASQPFTSALIMSDVNYFKYEWIWDKGRGFQPQLANIQPMKAHENGVVFGEGKITYNPQKTPTRPDHRKASGRLNNRKDGAGHNILSSVNSVNKIYTDRYPTTIIYFDNSNQAKKLHPTQKPLELYRYLIRTYTNEGETVLDICMGSGTTIEAAEMEGRNSIGIEKDAGYFQIAEKRAKSAVLQQRLFTPSNNRLHMDAGDSPRQLSQSTLEGFTPAEQGSTPAPRQ